MYLFMLANSYAFRRYHIIFAFKWILRFLGGEGKSERQIRQEIAKLKLQLQGLSMVDQFAAYAKLQRKINTLQQQYKDRGNIRNYRYRVDFDKCINVISLQCVLFMNYKTKSIVALTTLKWVLSNVFSLMFCKKNICSVSVVVWLGVVRSVCQRLAAYLSPTAAPSTNASRPTIPPAFFNPPPSTTTAMPVAPPLD
ncbi:unnamed protein product [Meganyctiphanes norvegica]|uniref:Guided entry of tail-anchored proteins factor 1 n=1 Tax=Meganyctiphanes norvegica TaxID=48144 RepID=A0AAV2QNJ7_MEGNR